PRCRRLAPRRCTPDESATPVYAVGRRLRTQPADRSLEILHGGGESRLTTESIFDGGHHVASGRKRCEHIRPVLEGAGLTRMAVEPTAAVNVDNEWAGCRGPYLWREVLDEAVRSKPSSRSY